MTLYEASLKRHSVRQYIDKPLSSEQIDFLSSEIASVNEETGLHVQLVIDELKAFGGLFVSTYGKFKNVSNYIVMAGKPVEGFEQNVGYYGEKLVLLAQTLGLNTCWVGLTYKKIDGVFSLEEGEKIACVIALGYGQTQGPCHKSKKPQAVSNVTEDSPEWFKRGVECALNAPTAVNQQKFYFELQSDGTVKSSTRFSMMGYTKIDLGIARLHFEIGAENAGHTIKG